MQTAHPNLFSMYMVYGIGSLALALNFLFLNPTSEPLGIPKEAIGGVFLVCSMFKLALLLWVHNATLLRLSMALTVAIMSFWAGILAFEFFRLQQTSLQLPIMFLIAAALGFLLLMEPPINPATKKNGKSV